MTDKLHCPTCGVHIDEHEATTCLDWWIATLWGETIRYPEVEDFQKVAGYCLNEEEVCYFDGSTLHKWVPSEDNAAAWQAVEKMRENGWEWQINIDRDKCDIVLWRVDDSGDVTGDGDGIAPTSSLAICRAAIKATAQAANE